ncbi:MAG: T9SS type A sorting domain-containing protein [Bacteroidota bacterium]
MTLWKVLHNKNVSIPSNTITQLNSAPCKGPYHYSSSDKAGGGWASLGRFTQTYVAQYEGSARTGDYNGLDYMLLHNLYYISEGANLSQPYVNLMDRVETYNFPYIIYVGSQSYNTHVQLGLFRSVTSNKTIEPDGWVTYRAGQEISLEPPFEVKEGAEFYAYVDPFECSTSGNYKSLADTTQTDSALAGNDPRDATNSLYGMHDPLPLKNKVIPLTYDEEEDIYPEYETMDTSSAKTLQDGFDIYPNPTPGEKFYAVISDSGFTSDQVLVVILDILGIEHYSKVFVIENDEHLLAIDPAGKLEAGIYMVIATSDNGIYRRKIVVQ